MKKIYLGKNWRFIRRNGKIYLVNLVTSRQLEITKDLEKTIDLLQRLREGVTKRTLRRRFCRNSKKKGIQWMRKSLAALERYHVLEKKRKQSPHFLSDYLMGLDRQIDFLEELFPDEGGYIMQKRLKNAHIAIIGLGTIAQYIILGLVASGVGKFHCVDFDIVEQRNIGRQPILRKKDIGKSKVTIVRRFIHESRAGVQVRGEKKMIQGVKDVKKIISDCDFVVHCADYPRFLIHRWINEACLQYRKPNLLVYSGRVGPLTIPYVSSCYGCLEAFLRRQLHVYKEITEIIKQEGLGRYPELAVVGEVTSALAAKEIVAYILGMPCETKNAFLDISPHTLVITKQKLPPQKDCYVCRKR